MFLSNAFWVEVWGTPYFSLGSHFLFLLTLVPCCFPSEFVPLFRRLQSGWAASVVCSASAWPASDFSHSQRGQTYVKLFSFSMSSLKQSQSLSDSDSGLSPTPHKLAHSLQMLPGSVRELTSQEQLPNQWGAGGGGGGQRLQLSSVRWTLLWGICHLLRGSSGLEPYMPTDLKETHLHLGFSYFPGSLFLLHTSSWGHFLSRPPPSNPCLACSAFRVIQTNLVWCPEGCVNWFVCRDRVGNMVAKEERTLNRKWTQEDLLSWRFSIYKIPGALEISVQMGGITWQRHVISIWGNGWSHHRAGCFRMRLSLSLVREVPQSLVVGLPKLSPVELSQVDHCLASFSEPVSLVPEAPILHEVGDCFTW